MKRTTIRLARLLIAIAFAPLVAQAQNALPPGQISYQGFLTDANGFPLATNAPRNVTIYFRIYNASSGATNTGVLWGEQQVVTVDRGYFTVLLGSGSSIGGVANTNDLTSLFNAPDASSRYVGMTVVDLSPAEIVPRLRLLAAPYSLLSAQAVNAANLVNASGISLVSGSGTNVTVNGALNATTVNGNGGGLTALNGSQITSGTVADARLSGNVALQGVNNTFVGTQTFQGVSGANPAYLRVFHPATSTFEVLGVDYNHALSSFSANGDFVITSQQGANKILLQPYTGVQGITIDTSGKVGIGTSSPGSLLDVNGDMQTEGNINLKNTGAIWGKNTSGTLEFCLFPRYSDNMTYLNFGSAGFNIRNNASTSRMFITDSGIVGIGTSTSPSKGQLEVQGTGGAYPQPANGWSLQSTGTSSYPGTSAGNYGFSSIWAAGNMECNAFIAFSDARIKRVDGFSDGASDLATLLGIKVTDFHYIDTIARGTAPQKKVIAQQVEKIYPQAVRLSTDTIPDVFTNALVKDGWVQLATNLKVGERVRLITDKEDAIKEVLEVRDGAFRTAFKPAANGVFVYGREVKDFRNVDYDAISILNVSATQELARKVEAQQAELAKLRTENAALAQKLAKLETRDQARENRLARLEKALDNHSATQQAKFKTSELSGNGN